MSVEEAIAPQHRARKAVLSTSASPQFIRCSTTARARGCSTPCAIVSCNLAGRKVQESTRTLVFCRGPTLRAGFERMVAEVCLGKVGSRARPGGLSLRRATAAETGNSSWRCAGW